MRYASNGDVRISYDVQGSGHPLVLVHANPFDHRLWMYQVASFAASGFQTIAVDLRGYGRSSKPEYAFTLRDMADDVLAVCAQEGIKRAVFAGVSVGSGISMLIALDQPELVDAVVLVGGSSAGPTDLAAQIRGYDQPDILPRYREHISTLVAPQFLESGLGAWLLDLFISQVPLLSGRCITEIFRARCSCDMTPRLPNLARPTLVVNGEHDNSLTRGRKTAALIPGARHVVLPGAGHACNIEDPVGFDRAVRPFLSGLGLPGPNFSR